MRIIATVLFVILCVLQFKIWGKDGELYKINSLKSEIAKLDDENRKLNIRNMALEAEVKDLKHRMGALEERARIDLGMIKHGEKFYQKVD